MPSLTLLGIASSLSVFGMAIIVPSIGSIADAFDADFSRVQFVISAYLFGLAIAQPLNGYFCDRFGRRPVMLTGFALFTLASAVAVVAPSLDLLIASRFVQAIGVSVGTVAARAILRDTRDGEEMAQSMSWVAAAMGVAPIIAPIVGGVLDAAFGYASIFAVTSGMGIVVFGFMYFRLPETLAPEHVQPEFRRWLANYGSLLRSTTFIGYTFVFGFVQGAFFCFLAIGAPLFQRQFGISAETFGVVWGALAVFYVGGATAAAKLIPRIGSDNVMRGSMQLLLFAGVAMLVVAWREPLTVLGVLLPLGIMMTVAGSSMPGAMAGAVRDHPTIAGSASGLSSAIGLVLSGAFTILSGVLFDGNLLPIAALMFATCVAAGLSASLAARAATHRERPAPRFP